MRPSLAFIVRCRSTRNMGKAFNSTPFSLADSVHVLKERMPLRVSCVVPSQLLRPPCLSPKRETRGETYDPDYGIIDSSGLRDT